MARACCSPFYEGTRAGATCWTALWHLDASCYEGCKGHGTADGLPQLRMELAKRSHPGAPKACRPHYTWKDGAMQDLNALGPRLQLDLLRDWPKLALDRELWREVASRC